MWSMPLTTTVATVLLSHALTASSLSLDVHSTDSIKSTAKTIAASLVSNYSSPPTNASEWWQGALMYNALIDYWALTGDEEYNSMTKQALFNQSGSQGDFMPSQQSGLEINSEQAIWALAAMNAAEVSFFTEGNGNVSWLGLAETVFNEQAARWDANTCGGGLRDGINPAQALYGDKTSTANGFFMELASRLGVFTGNATYSEWPEKVWKWSESIGLLDSNYSVYELAQTEDKCQSVADLMWTMNFGAYLSSAAIQYNSTNGDKTWKSRLDGVLSRTNEVFFPNSTDIMVEVACETIHTCNGDILVFKSVLARALADVVTFAPYTESIISSKIQTSATAAAKQCNGGSANETYCGFSWIASQDDGFTGLGQQVSALQIVLANLNRPKLATVNQTSSVVASGSTTSSSGSSSASTTGPSATQSGVKPTGTGAGSSLVSPFYSAVAGVALAAFFLGL